MARFGEHDGHQVVPHDHRGQLVERRSADGWCSGRWCCVTCSSKELPRGTWFDGPRCPAPARVARPSVARAQPVS